MGDDEPRDVVRRSFRATSTGPAAARDFVARAVADLGLDRLVGDAGLVVSELATNAVLHGAGPLEVTVGPIDRGLRITVSDRGPGRPQIVDGPGSAEVGGHGLRIVDHIAATWGVAPSSTSGKTVWADLA